MPLGIKGFLKGRAKTGGRRKGARNRPKVRKTIALESTPLLEKECRQLLKNVETVAAAAPAPTSTTSTPSPATSPGPELNAAPRASHHHGLHETPLETWQRKRRQAKNLSAGQVANMLDGLTPDGYDRDGRKVSFVESDKPFRGSRRGLSGY